MDKKILPDKDYDLWVLLHQTRDAINTVREKELIQYGITPMEAAVLFIIQAASVSPTITEIARWMFRKPHSVSGIVSRMEKRGLVKRTSDTKRKNVIRVKMTSKGRKAFPQSMMRESIYNVISSLTNEQRDGLTKYLGILRNTALKNIGVSEKPPFPQVD